MLSTLYCHLFPKKHLGCDFWLKNVSFFVVPAGLQTNKYGHTTETVSLYAISTRNFSFYHLFNLINNMIVNEFMNQDRVY